MTIQTRVQQPIGDWAGRDLLDADFDALGDADDDSPWVDAAPFRAHVRHLMAETGVAWRTIAVLADVPAPSVEHLLRGRRGRPVLRLHPSIAGRLFHLTRDVVADASARRLHAGRTQTLLQFLVGRGWTIRDIARRSRLPEPELAAIMAGRQTLCSQLLAATVKSAAQALWDRRLPRRPVEPAQQVRRTRDLVAA